jgi:ankyrin repeat protein
VGHEISEAAMALLSSIPFVGNYFGGESQQKLLFVPDADNKPEKDHEISEPALFRFLLNEETLKELDEADGAEIPDMLDVLKDIDKESKITEFETHQSSMGSAKDFKGAFHVFIVFKTTSGTDGVYWWSLEKNRDYIALQRSRNKNNVKDHRYGETRHQAKPIVENLIGKGTIKDLFALLWAQQMIVDKYHLMESNCQSFVTFVGQQITNIRYTYEGVFKFTPPENDREKEMLDLINILTVTVVNWHPLFSLIYLENTHLFNTISKSGKYNMGITQHGFTLLNFVIVFSKTKMVELLLNSPYSADPTTRDDQGRNALQIAAVYTEQPEVFDLLLAHSKVNVDDVDENGKTALHWAVCASNVAAVQKLLEKGANPKIDKVGMSPLHMAALRNRGTEIIDLILEAKKARTGNQGIDDVNDKHGMTALHCAAYSSNEITAEHLINKGADVNRRDIGGRTPLHVAAIQAKDMKIIGVLLKNIRDEEINQYKKDAKLLPYACNNVHGLGDDIIERLVAKGMVSNEQVRNLKVLEALNAITQEVAQDRRSKSSNEQHGLGGAMANRMEEAESDRNLKVYEDFRKTNTFKADDVGDAIAQFIGDNSIKMEDKFGQVFHGVLSNAIMDSDVEKACSLSKQFGEHFSKVRWKGMNALHAASACAKKTEILDVILDSGNFDINGRDANGWTPLHYASRYNNITTARHLLEKEADPTLGNDDGGITPFHFASAYYVREADILGLFLANNKQFDIDHRNKSGMTALHVAIKVSNTAAAEFLLTNGANPNAADRNGITPLHVAAGFAKDMDIVKLLLNHKDVDVNYLDNNGNYALLYTMTNENGLGKEIADLLKGKRSAKAEGINHEPENMAALVPEGRIEQDADIETIRLLIEDGQDVSAMTWGENGANALHLAAADEETTDLIDVILETGKFDINGVDSDGRTPLHYAIERPDPVTINARRLIKMGADPGIADKNGVTPLHMAARNENAESMDLIEILLNTEAVDVNCVDYQGRTPLAFAWDNKHGLSERIANRLKENGAVRVEEEICRDNLLDECTGEEATGNSLDNDEDENESETENPKKAPTFKIVVDSNGEKIRIQIKKGTKQDNGKCGDHVMNALRSAPRNAKATELIDISLDTESRDPHVTTTPESTSDDDNENWVKEVLEEAIAHSDAEKVRNLIETGADLGKVTWTGGRNALHAASQHAQKTEILDVILATGDFDINGRVDTHEDGWTPLHFALRVNNMTTVRYLLEKGADPTIGTHDGGITQFHAAAAYVGESDILDLFLANNKQFDIDHRNQSGMTALHMAIKESNTAAAKFLLSNGANPNAADRNGRTPLHVAAYYTKDMDIVKLLLNRKNVNVNYLDNSGKSALQYALSNEHGLGEAIANLLRGKMAMKTKGINHEPENMAAPVPACRIKQDSDMETIRFLIENGQDVSAMTWGENGANALHLAVANEETMADLIDVILETGKFDINGVDSDGRTPLHYAIMHERNVPHLIGKGADPNIADKNGVTPLHMAVIHAESMDLIDILLKTKKLEVNDYDDNGLAARDCARYNKHGLGDTIIARLTEYIEMESPTGLSASRTIILACICFCLLAYVVSANTKQIMF